LAALLDASSESPSSNLQSARFEARALETLRYRFAEPNNGHGDETILTIAILIKVEVSRLVRGACTILGLIFSRKDEEMKESHWFTAML
jgi:hypothetical protein